MKYFENKDFLFKIQIENDKALDFEFNYFPDF